MSIVDIQTRKLRQALRRLNLQLRVTTLLCEASDLTWDKAMTYCDSLKSGELHRIVKFKCV